MPDEKDQTGPVPAGNTSPPPATAVNVVPAFPAVQKNNEGRRDPVEPVQRPPKQK